MKYIPSLLCGILALSSTWAVAEAQPSNERVVTNTAPANAWFAKDRYRLTIGNFTSFGAAQSGKYFESTGRDGDTAGYSNTYIDGAYETPIFKKFQIGVGAQVHFFTLDHNDIYDVKYPSDQDIFMTDSYLKFHATEELMIEGGRFNVREISSHLDPQYGQGVFVQYANDDELSLRLGVLDKFAYFYDDFVRDYEDVDDEDRFDYGDLDAAQDIGDKIYFSEFNMRATDFLTLNPYVFYQEKYVGWYGLDTELATDQNFGTIGTRVKMYYLDSMMESDTVDDIGEGSFNFAINPFVSVGDWRVEGGYARFGSNDAFNNPSWGYRNFTACLYDDLGGIEVVDHNGLYGTKETDVYFGRIGFQRETWNLHTSLAYYATDYSPTEDELYELQVGGGLQITDHISFGSRIVGISAKEHSGVTNQDRAYFESWLRYNL